MERSAEFALCMPGGTNWYFIDKVWKESLTMSDISLSNIQYFGMNPRLVRSEITSMIRAFSEIACLDLRGRTKM
jgi:hypothetical protein